MAPTLSWTMYSPRAWTYAVIAPLSCPRLCPIADGRHQTIDERAQVIVVTTMRGEGRKGKSAMQRKGGEQSIRGICQRDPLDSGSRGLVSGLGYITSGVDRTRGSAKVDGYVRDRGRHATS